MKRAFVLFLAFVSSLAAFAQAPDPSGTWLGKLEVQGLTLRIVLHISKAADGTFKSTIDSPDQGAKDVKVPTIKQEGDKLSFSVFGATYEGKYAADRKKINGTFKQAGMELPLTFERQEKALDFSRPQDPKPPFPYKSEDVVYKNTKQNITLAGSLTIPQGTGPFPAAIMITGSGAENRNEEILGHRPFLVIADYLSRHGIAVLRVDDRGVGGSSGSTPNSTTADFVTDVEAGINFLKTRSEVDRKHIGLIGHSEGGIIAPMVASERKDVDFIVMLAGTGMTGRELLPIQAKAILDSMGTSKEQSKNDEALQDAMLDIEAKETDPIKRKQKLHTAFLSGYNQLSADEKKKIGPVEPAFTAAIRPLESPWFRFFLTLDPIPYIEKVQCRALVLNGSLDRQVPPKENLPRIEAALKKGGNTRYEIHELPGLNHLFQHTKTGSPTEYSQIDETFSPDVLQLIGEWILRVSR